MSVKCNVLMLTGVIGNAFCDLIQCGEAWLKTGSNFLLHDLSERGKEESIKRWSMQYPCPYLYIFFC